LGQRKGLGIGGVKNYQSEDGIAPAWFVARKDLENNTLIVVNGHDHPWLLNKELVAEDVSWVAGHAPEAGNYAAKTRYRQADAPCSFKVTDNGFSLSFPEAQWAVTPGQSAVLYDGDVCLGGGIIY
jgi:tRNA-specific 2-thiouridylase